MPLNFRPKIEKIVELLLYLAHKRPNADKYQAVKFFYLADREHLRRYGRPITFDNYYALWFGPVASNALDILNEQRDALESVGISKLPFEMEIGTVKTKSGKDAQTTFIRKPLREVNLDMFSESDVEVFDEVLAKYGDASFDDLFRLTHNHFAYDHAWRTRRHGDHAEMLYEEMIDDEKLRETMVEDLGPIAAHMK
jgi:uncharacterized phage-associated protein